MEDRRELAEALVLDDATLKERVEGVRESMTPDETLSLMEDIANDTEDIDTVEPMYRIAFLVREAYVRGVLVGLDSYREAIKATLEAD